MGRRSKESGRSLFKPAFWMVSICSLLAGAATVAEKFFNSDNPLSEFAGMMEPGRADAKERETAGQAVLITPSGKLTAEQRQWMLEQARKGAPIPVDKENEATSPEAQRDLALERIEKALQQQQKGG